MPVLGIPNTTNRFSFAFVSVLDFFNRSLVVDELDTILYFYNQSAECYFKQLKIYIALSQ